MGTYIDGVLATRDYMDEVNKELWAPIELDEENQMLVDAVQGVKDSGLTGQAALDKLFELGTYTEKEPAE